MSDLRELSGISNKLSPTKFCEDLYETIRLTLVKNWKHFSNIQKQSTDMLQGSSKFCKRCVWSGAEVRKSYIF